MKKLNTVFLLAGIVFFLTSCTSKKNQDVKAKLGWPEISNQTKPWTRWWWMGSSVDKKNLSLALEKYAKAGLGGMELTTIYGEKGKESEFINYTSPKWMEMLTYTLSEAKRLDLGVDMALASGWPFGGPWVGPEDACKYLQIKTYELKQGERLGEKIEFTEKPIIRSIGKRVTIDEIKDPVASNDSLQMFAFDQVRFPRKLPLISLMAYSENGQVLDVTSKVDSSGTLNWDGQTNDWTLIAAFSGWHGKMVERAGPGGEGDVIDHFSLQAIQDYLGHFDKSFEGYDISYLRAFFNDSYEVDDAYGEANWTPDFFSEFQNRRGYDLRDHLLALIGKTTEEEQQRILCDYRETISDLLLDKYTIPWQQWAEKKSKIIRNQSHGSPANILDLYAASDIPETEGIDLMNIKFASSAAHVTGKQIISAEAATWLNEHFLANLSQTKENIDRYLIGGVNHIIYHGTAYSPEDEPWPGRMFYAAVHYAPTNSLWRDFPALNAYVTRSQAFLQRGTADNDILLYFPIFDQWMEPGRASLVHFHGAEKGSAVYTLAQELQDKGYSFDFISDKQIKNLTEKDGRLLTEGGAQYKTLLIPKVEYIPLKTFETILNLAEKGIKIVFMGQLPGQVPGFAHVEKQNSELSALKEALVLKKEKNGIQEYSIGNGLALVGNNFEKLLDLVEINRETLVDGKLQYIRLKDHGSTLYFISNWADEAFSGWVPLLSSCETVVRYNLATGVFGKAKCTTSEKGKKSVLLQLNKGESCILQLWPETKNVEDYKYWKVAGDSIQLNTDWTISFVEGGPFIPAPETNTGLKSWTTFGDTASYFSGTAIYTLNFEKPDVKCEGWDLNLGKVYETASIKLNGNDLGTLVGPVYNLTFNNKLLEQNNKLEIYVSNLMANRIRYMDKNGIPYRNFYNVNFSAKLREDLGPDRKFTSINWEPNPSGIIGPVTLTPLDLDKQ
jgi:hypothetical protein